MMDLEQLGQFMLENSHRRIVGITMRCLGYTAIALETLLDEVYDTDEAAARWGIEDNLAGSVGFEPTNSGFKGQ